MLQRSIEEPLGMAKWRRVRGSPLSNSVGVVFLWSFLFLFLGFRLLACLKMHVRRRARGCGSAEVLDLLCSPFHYRPTNPNFFSLIHTTYPMVLSFLFYRNVVFLFLLLLLLFLLLYLRPSSSFVFPLSLD